MIDCNEPENNNNNIFVVVFSGQMSLTDNGEANEEQ